MKNIFVINLLGEKANIQAVLKDVKGEHIFDLNRIIAMPAGLREVRDCITLKSDMKTWEKAQLMPLTKREKSRLHICFKDSKSSITHYQNAYKAVRCLDKYGVCSGKKWAQENWGIGSPDIEDVEINWNGEVCQITFKAVPFSGLTPVIKVLEEKYQNVLFEWKMETMGVRV